MPTSSWDQRQFGYFIDGNEGEAIFTFKSQRLPLFFFFFFFPPLFLLKDHQEIETESPGPGDDGMKSHECDGHHKIIISRMQCVIRTAWVCFLSTATAQKSIIFAKYGIFDFPSMPHTKCLKLFLCINYAYIQLDLLPNMTKIVLFEGRLLKSINGHHL